MSIAWELLTWAKTSLDNASIGAPVLIRRRSVRVKGDADPLIVLSSTGPETLVRRSTEGYATLAFPIDAVIYTGQSQSYLSPEALHNMRAAIRAVLLKPKPGVDLACLASYDPSPVLPQDSFADGYDVSPQRFVFHGAELIGV